jgi:hypothetical protein
MSVNALPTAQRYLKSEGIVDSHHGHLSEVSEESGQASS